MNDYPVAGHLQIRLATVIYFNGGNHLAEVSFQLRFDESPFFGGSGLIRLMTGLGLPASNKPGPFYVLCDKVWPSELQPANSPPSCPVFPVNSCIFLAVM